MQCSLDLIDRDSRTQARVSTCDDTVDEYVAALENGEEFPKVVLFWDGEKAFIGDGWQRIAAHQAVGREEINADMRDGVLRDAILYAAGANTEHGLRRSNEDKRRAVEMMLDDPVWRLWSQRKIAEHCRVSTWLVSEVQNSRTKPQGEGVVDERDDELAEGEGQDNEDVEEEEEDVREPDEDEPDEAEPDKILQFSGSHKEWIATLRRIKREMVDVAADPVKGIFLRDKITRIGRAMDEVRSMLRGVEVTQECGTCDGRGCAECLTTGLLTRHMVESRKKI